MALINELQWSCVAAVTLVGYLHHPEVQQLMYNFLGGARAKAWFNRKDGTSYVSKLPPILASAQAGPQFALFFTRTLMSSAISIIYDTALQSHLADHSPEFEFLRHLRNAVSHGNRFTFRGSEPRRPARFGTFVVDSSLNGLPSVLFD